jgi:hypothetical protein
MLAWRVLTASCSKVEEEEVETETASSSSLYFTSSFSVGVLI